ncbi:MAG: hypothetical protein ACTFAL_09650 [Candidatus Electronema sp. V4]|uniref:hypothetical protein n=1 Tax=Candidatus Electronema sp. V4 TaxID=3454756 RepID=UPI0040555B79
MKRIESAFRIIKQRFSAHIHAVTRHGFELKVFLFILAYGIKKFGNGLNPLIVDQVLSEYRPFSK